MKQLLSFCLSLSMLSGAFIDATGPYSLKEATDQIVFHFQELNRALEKLTTAVEEERVKIVDKERVLESLAGSRAIVKELLSHEDSLSLEPEEQPWFVLLNAALENAIESWSTRSSAQPLDSKFKLVFGYTNSLSALFSSIKSSDETDLIKSLTNPNSKLFYSCSDYLGATIALVVSALEETPRTKVLQQFQLLEVMLEMLEKAVNEDKTGVCDKEQVKSYLSRTRMILSHSLKADIFPIHSKIPASWDSIVKETVSNVIKNSNDSHDRAQAFRAIEKEIINQNMPLLEAPLTEPLLDTIVLVARCLGGCEAAVFNLPKGLERTIPTQESAA